jgi:hypothetical protein
MDYPDFLEVGTPVAGTGNFGCPGNFQFYGEDQTVSVANFYCMQELLLEFTGRI